MCLGSDMCATEMSVWEENWHMFCLKGPLVEFAMEFVTFQGSPSTAFWDLFAALPNTRDSNTSITICEACFPNAVSGPVFG